MAKKSGKETLRTKFHGQIQEKLQSGLPKKINDAIQSTVAATVSATMNSKVTEKIAERLNESAHLAQTAQRVATQTASQTVHLATETAHLAAERVSQAADTAKQSLDQVLIGLEHRGINVKEPSDIAHKIGRKVLERADEIRAQVREQIASNPLTPNWLKTVAQTAQHPAADASVKTESGAEAHSTTRPPEAAMAKAMATDFSVHDDDDDDDDENEGVEIDVAPAKKARKSAPRTTRSKAAGATRATSK